MAGIACSVAGCDEITEAGLWPSRQGRGSGNGDDYRHAPDATQVEICERWIQIYCVRTARINRKVSSYSLKHAVEGWTDRLGPRAYVSNGAFIEAARRLGFRIVRASPGSQNAAFDLRVDHQTAVMRSTEVAIGLMRRIAESLPSREQREAVSTALRVRDAVVAGLRDISV